MSPSCDHDQEAEINPYMYIITNIIDQVLKLLTSYG